MVNDQRKGRLSFWARRTELLSMDHVQSSVPDGTKQGVHVCLYGCIRSLVVDLAGLRDGSLVSQDLFSGLPNLGVFLSDLGPELLYLDVLLPDAVFEERLALATVHTSLLQFVSCFLLYLERSLEVIRVRWHVCASRASRLEPVVLQLQLFVLDAALTVCMSAHSR